jgi:hypothetical protein
MSEIPEKNDSITYIGSALPGGMGEDHIQFSTTPPRSDYYFEYDRNKTQDFWEEDGISLTGNPYTSPDVLSLSSHTIPTQSKTTQEHFWKFGEGETLKAVNDYIVSTYRSHYASEKSKVQVLDMIDAIGDGVPFCRDNLIKYSSRFGKKDGMSRLDALKIIHYGVLLYHFAGFNNQTKNNNETF